MTDIFTKKKRSEIMSQIRGKNTSPERIIRKALRAEGYAYRLQYGSHKIDVAFPRKKVAVFVDGCFWHKCPVHFRMPKSNIAFWKRKIYGNAKRDKNLTRVLRKKGWRVIHVWEHELNSHPWKVLNRIKGSLENGD
ncbi:very short patch repair endonuclease [Candidatus Micrarchaeota archaeon]|nr:very short patch repair endonuclease [Candidatus Micrarchaeota archaeon]